MREAAEYVLSSLIVNESEDSELSVDVKMRWLLHGACAAAVRVHTEGDASWRDNELSAVLMDCAVDGCVMHDMSINYHRSPEDGS